MSLFFSLLFFAQTAPPRVPEGFTVAKVSPADVSFPMFAAFDDTGRLFVTESSGDDLYLELQKLVRRCRVRLLEDRDGDGIFERSGIFAEGLTPSMGLAWRDGKLYVADPPDLAVLEDTDGDGKADRRTVLLTGFGHTDNGSLHGLVFGPDGMLYMTTGEPDGYEIRRQDGTMLKGLSGALFRCRPDGSGLEVLARGFENLIEVVFLPSGDIVGTCNWYQKPVGGVRDALVHLLDGGLYPYAPERGTPQPVTGDLIPPLSLFPAVALSGLCRTPSGLFSAQHNTRKVMRHVLERSGSSFTSTDLDFLTSDDPDFHPSDVLEAKDGSLLVVDTGAWYVQHCPTAKIGKTRAPGGIWRVKARTSPPIGETLKAALAESEARDLWGYAEGGEDGVGHLTGALRGPHGATAARVFSRMGERGAAPALGRLLAAPAAHLRLAAAEALARCGTPESLPAIWESLADDPDAFLEHALVHAAHRIADAAALQAALAHESPRVQKAALILLDQPPRSGVRREDVTARITSPDPELRKRALRILQSHADWAPQAIALLRTWLGKERPTEEERGGLASSILAFQESPAVQESVGKALQEPGVERRLVLLDTLAQTSLKTFPKPWSAGLLETILDPDPAVRLATVRAIGVLQLASFDDLLVLLGGKPAEDPNVRLEALRAVVTRRPKLGEASIGFLLGQLAGEAIPRLAAAEVLRRATLEEAALARILKAIRSDALLSPSIFLPALRGSGGPALEETAESIRSGWRPSPAELGLLLERLPADVRTLLGKAAEEQRERMARYEPLLKGGDAARGRELFHGKKVACGGCHAVGAQGGKVGPDLTKIGAIRSGRDLLESILVPSSTFAQGYESYVAATQGGDVLTGLVARQSAETLVLRDSSGGETQLRKDRIRELKRAEKSVMPEGLERALTPEEFRDLLAFLQGLR